MNNQLTVTLYNVTENKGIDGWVGINSDNLSQKVRITTNDPSTVLVDVTTPLAKFLGFKTAHVPSAYVVADGVYNLTKTKYASIDFNRSDQYSELKYGAPLVTFIVPISAQSGIINYDSA